MRERANLIGGQLTIDSSPGQGTRIQVTVPTTPELNRVNHSLASGR
jgi:nitrate/nitrite-specific signal transduction histidine kinase